MDLDLDSIIDPSDMESSWLSWKQEFLRVMGECIPSSTLPDRKNLPWLTKEIIQLIHKRTLTSRKHNKTILKKNKKKTNKQKSGREIIHIGTRRGVGFHLLVARFHSNLSLLTSVCEVVVSGTDIVVHPCCLESQQSPFKGCRGIVQELLEWRVTRLD